MMHRHVWKVAEKEIHPSKAEGITKAMAESDTKIGDFNAPLDFFDRKLIVTYECSECGYQSVEVKSV